MHVCVIARSLPLRNYGKQVVNTLCRQEEHEVCWRNSSGCLTDQRLRHFTGGVCGGLPAVGAAHSRQATTHPWRAAKLREC